MNQKEGSLFIVSGPSGVGKTTAVRTFLNQNKNSFKVDRVVTYTTKQPRRTEVDGIDYHFITEDEFKSKVRDQFFLEWSGEYGACYGTPASIVDDVRSGTSRILVIDRHGASQIIAKHPQVVLIWIYVSSLDVLLDRLTKRKTESVEQIQRRLVLAKKEIDKELSFPLYHYHIVNNSLEEAVASLSEVVLASCLPIEIDLNKKK